jgi:hypothetical protein
MRLIFILIAALAAVAGAAAGPAAAAEPVDISQSDPMLHGILFRP